MPEDDEHEHEIRAIGVPIPAAVVHQMMHDHDTARGRAEERHHSALRWLDSLDVEGLMALRYVLATDETGAYGNNRLYEGMVVQLLRRHGVDPQTGLDPAAQLLAGVAAPGTPTG